MSLESISDIQTTFRHLRLDLLQRWWYAVLLISVFKIVNQLLTLLALYSKNEIKPTLCDETQGFLMCLLTFIVYRCKIIVIRYRCHNNKGWQLYQTPHRNSANWVLRIPRMKIFLQSHSYFYFKTAAIENESCYLFVHVIIRLILLIVHLF